MNRHAFLIQWLAVDVAALVIGAIFGRCGGFNRDDHYDVHSEAPCPQDQRSSGTSGSPRLDALAGRQYALRSAGLSDSTSQTPTEISVLR